mgnify:CR=1 FL=1
MKVNLPNVEISAITACLPQKILKMDSLGTEYGEKEVENIMKATGIEQVHVAESDQTSSDLCYKAALHLFEKEKLNPNEIDGLIFVSQTCDFLLPATSIILQDKLALKKDTVCIDIHYGCTGYIYGILQAAVWIVSGVCDKVILLAGDTTTRMINSKDKSLRMVFGDCGTASLIKKGENNIAISAYSDGSGYDKLIVPAGGFRIPISSETKKIIIDSDNNGRTPEDLYMDGMAIFDFAIHNVYKDINDLIDFIGWEKTEIGLFALHQANVFIVNYIRKKLNVDPERVPTNVKKYGNTGPGSIPLLLCDICSTAHHFDLSKVILSGFGVGLSWGSIACNISETNFYKPIIF